MSAVENEIPRPTLLYSIGLSPKRRGERGIYKCGLCGNEFMTTHKSVERGYTRSCGCLRTGAKPKHGHASRVDGYSPTYRSWANMIGNHRDVVAAEWHEFESFLADMGEKEAGQQLSRRDESGGYDKNNCYWR